jgi:hypothetical protein
MALTFLADEPAGSNSDASQASTTDLATSEPIMRAPMVIICALLDFAARSAEYVSCVRAARMPGILLAEMQTPIPVPPVFRDLLGSDDLDKEAARSVKFVRSEQNLS